MIRGLNTLFNRPRQLSGGIFLPRLERAAATGPIRPFALPTTLTALLRQGDGPGAAAIVAPGEMVEFGQQIGRADAPGGLHVHAPAGGRVVGIVRADSARHTDAPAIRIETCTDRPKPEGAPPSYEVSGRPGSETAENHPDTFFSAAQWAGLTTCRAGAGSLAEELREARRGVAHLIVNTLAGEPIASGAVIEWPGLLVRACGWIGEAFGAQRISVAADLADRPALKRMRAAARGLRVRIVGLVNKYPQHAPVLLAWNVAGIETPPGHTPLGAGVLVLEAEAVFHLAAALAWLGHEPAPMTHRAVTVAGPAIVHPGRYWIPIGTSFADILNHVGFRQTPKRVVDGGPITGRAVPHLDVVTTKETSGILVLERAADRVPSPGPCIRCGWCQEDCPVGLDPQLLLNFAERNDAAGAAAYYPQACIECGLCSYVCPAELPLASATLRLKRTLQAGKATT